LPASTEIWPFPALEQVVRLVYAASEAEIIRRTTMRREFSRRLITEAMNYGAEACFVEHGKKHPKLRVVFRGATLTYVFPASPSDHRSIKNCLCGLRRLMASSAA
jgi:hypothetical protein